MNEIDFLTLEDVLRIHDDQVRRYGGSAEIRDTGLLQSAIAMPQTTYGGQHLHGDVFAMAAAYLFHIVQNHPFVDGNKRTGTVAALVFLELNGIDTNATEEELEELIWCVARGEANKQRVGDFLRQHS